jgi:hypothetical protein
VADGGEGAGFANEALALLIELRRGDVGGNDLERRNSVRKAVDGLEDEPPGPTSELAPQVIATADDLADLEFHTLSALDIV